MIWVNESSSKVDVINCHSFFGHVYINAMPSDEFIYRIKIRLTSTIHFYDSVISNIYGWLWIV